MSERRGVLFVNPRSGGNGENDLDELRAAAEEAGAEVRVLREGDDLEGLARHTHADALGLAGMRERVALAGGRLQVESSPGSGTTLVAEVPSS